MTNVLQINNATTVDGTIIGNDGRDVPGAARWFGHDDTYYASKSKTWNNWRLKYSEGCFITTEINLTNLPGTKTVFDPTYFFMNNRSKR